MTSTAAPDVAYVLTHHPATALTFISLEIREIEASGGRVTAFAVNESAAVDLQTAEAQAVAASTSYLKREGSIALATAVAAVAVRHPGGLARLAWRAATSARFDAALAARRLVHLTYACWVWRSIRHQPTRHVHAHFGQTPATIAWFTALVGNLFEPEGYTWSFTIHGFQDFADERVSRLDLKVRSASFVACVSDFTRAQLCRVTDPQWWDRYHVIRCGVDLGALPRRRGSGPSTPLRILTVARLSPEKGHLVLIDALRQLADQEIAVDLRIVGNGPSEEAIRRHVEALGIAERVTLVGQLEPAQVMQELVAADVFCLPSFAEGIPVSIMEAMAVGVPVVTTFVGGIPELAVDDETALVVPPSNVDDLAAAIRRLVDEPGLASRLADAAATAVAERHDVVANVELLRQQFQNCAARR